MAATKQTGPFNYAPKSTAVPANLQEFTATGTWTKPAGATFVVVELWGAGGGGGGGIASTYTGTSNLSGGGGGGGGAYVQRFFTAAELPSTVLVTVGAGGAGGAAGASGLAGGSGLMGGPSYFGPTSTPYAVAYSGSGGASLAAVASGTPEYAVGGLGGGGMTNGEPLAFPGTNSSDTSSHFGSNATYRGSNAGWGGGSGGGALGSAPLSSRQTPTTGGGSVIGGSAGGGGASWTSTSVNGGAIQGGTFAGRGQNTSNPSSTGCNGVDGAVARAGGNGGGAGARQTVSANASGIAANGARIITGGTSNAFTSYTTADSGATIYNAPNAYDSGTTIISTPIRAVSSDGAGNFYGYGRGTTYRKIWTCGNIALTGFVWTQLFDFTPLISTTTGNIVSYTIAGGRHFAAFDTGAIFVSVDSTGTEFTLVPTVFTSGITYVAYDTTRSLWVIMNSASASVIYTTTDFITLTTIANLPAAGIRNGIVVTSTGRWVVATAGTNNIRYTDDAGATAWVTVTSGLPAVSGTPTLQLVNGIIVWSNGSASFTVIYSSTDNGITWGLVAAPPSRASQEVVWDGTNYVVVLDGSLTLVVFASSPDFTSTSTWTTRSATSPILTGGGKGGGGAAPGGGGGGGGSCFTGTSFPGFSNTAGAGGAGARGLVRVYSW